MVVVVVVLAGDDDDVVDSRPVQEPRARSMHLEHWLSCFSHIRSCFAGFDGLLDRNGVCRSVVLVGRRGVVTATRVMERDW